MDVFVADGGGGVGSALLELCWLLSVSFFKIIINVVVIKNTMPKNFMNSLLLSKINAGNLKKKLLLDFFEFYSQFTINSDNAVFLVWQVKPRANVFVGKIGRLHDYKHNATDEPASCDTCAIACRRPRYVFSENKINNDSIKVSGHF